MISVIIPIYNAAEFLLRTIRCIQMQTFSDFEVLLINDGSTDDSERICVEIVQLDNRFRLVSQENAGVSSARNRGMQCATGEYVTFLDADDEIPANYLQELWQAAMAHHAPMVVCDVVIIDDGRETSRFTHPSGTLPQRQALNYLLSRREINSGPCAKLFRREILLDLAFPPLRVYEDIVFIAEVMCRCNCIAVTNQTEYRYIQNDGGAMGSISRMPSTDIVKAMSWLMEFLRDHQDLDPSCFYITVSHLMQYVQLVVGRPEKEARDFISAARLLIRKCIWQILRCHAFPSKEKIVFILFAYGLLYYDRKLYRV